MAEGHVLLRGDQWRHFPVILFDFRFFQMQNSLDMGSHMGKEGR